LEHDTHAPEGKIGDLILQDEDRRRSARRGDDRLGQGLAVTGRQQVNARWRASAALLALAGLLCAVTVPTKSAAQTLLKTRNIDVSRERATEQPLCEGDQAIVDGWPLYRTDKGQAAFNDAMATLKATDEAAPAPEAFRGCADLACNLTLPAIGADGWIPAGRLWVSPTDYVLFVHSPRLPDGQAYRRRVYATMRYFVLHEFHSSTRNTDAFDTLSSHSGSVFVPLYMSKVWTDAQGRRFVMVIEVAPYDVVSIHAANKGSAGPGMEVAKNMSETLEPLQGLAGILVATIIKAAAPHLEVVNHHAAEGLAMLTAYQNRLAILRARRGTPRVALPFAPAVARRVAAATGRLEELIQSRGASPIPTAERGPQEARVAAAPPATPALSPLAIYLRANLLTLKRLPAFAGIIPQDVAAIAEETPEAGVVYLLAANQQILGSIRAHRERGVVVQGKYVYVPARGALAPATPFELDLARPVSLRSASLTPWRQMQPIDEPTLVEPIRPATRPASAEPVLVEPIRPAIRPVGLGTGR
jgi:hypothetical protein